MNNEKKDLITMDGEYTSNGIDARVICIDSGDPDYPVIAILKGRPLIFTARGEYSICGAHQNCDLIKKLKTYTGWVNVYPSSTDRGFSFSRIFKDKDAADNDAQSDLETRIACIEITFPEGEGL